MYNIMFTSEIFFFFCSNSLSKKLENTQKEITWRNVLNMKLQLLCDERFYYIIKYNINENKYSVVV